MICLIFSRMSTSQVDEEEVWETIVVLAPGGAVLTFLTVELPVKRMLSNTALNWYLSTWLDLPFSVTALHSFLISGCLNLLAVSELTACSKSA